MKTRFFGTASAVLLVLLTLSAAAQAQHPGSADRRYHHSDRAFHTADRRFHAADRAYHRSGHHTAA